MRLLITGASGQLGAYLLRAARDQGFEVIAWSGTRTGELEGIPLHPVNISNPNKLVEAFRQARPTVVIHTAALASVAACYQDPAGAVDINHWPTLVLADLAQKAGSRLIFTSTDLVFDGEKGGYREQDAPSPLSMYGRTKMTAEPAVLATSRGVVARLSLLYGPTRNGRPGFYDEQVKALRERRPIQLFADEWRTPLSLAAAARALVTLAAADFNGLIHVGGAERLSRLEMGRRLAVSLELGPSPFVAVTRESFPAPEPRPRDVSLDCGHWQRVFPDQPLPGWVPPSAEWGS